MDSGGGTTPTALQRVTALAGLVATPIVVLVAVGALWVRGWAWVVFLVGLLALVAGYVARRSFARRFPITAFDLNDVSGPATEIESAKVRLAGGDYAAFTVNAVRNEDEPEANGQIWFFAAEAGGIEKTSIELSYNSATDPREHPAFTGMFADYCEVSSWEPDHWVLLTRLDDVAASEAILLVADMLRVLHHLEGSLRWTFRAFA